MNAAFLAFREPYLLSDPIRAAITGDFNDYDARRLRYALLWAHFENSVYSKLHNWSKTYMVQYGLYEYTRNIKNPTYQLGEFWKSHLWGGQLDPEAGDGQQKPSALPIETESDALRPAIAQIWKWSNWQLQKDLATLWGSILGDVVLTVVDDVVKKKVCVRILHPGVVREVDKDAYGNIKSYCIEEEKQDPDVGTVKMVTYREEAAREGDDVIYKTYKDNSPYAWPGQVDLMGKKVAEWVHPYGFIPMVIIQHNNVGLDWGWSEVYPLLSRIREIDDLSAKLDDQIRKLVDPFILYTGISKPTATPEATKETLTGTALLNRPQLGREAQNALYATNPDAKAIPVVAPLEIQQAAGVITDLLNDIKQNCPELMNLFEAGNDPSGRAIRITRQPVEAKVQQRRANYDDALVRIQQMAISIGGYREYDVFKSFTLESYDAGELEHSIGQRPVFPKDPIDETEVDKMFWDAAVSATSAGMTLEAYLRDKKWDEERLRPLLNSEEYKLKLEGQKVGLEGMKKKNEEPEQSNQDEPPNEPPSKQEE